MTSMTLFPLRILGVEPFHFECHHPELPSGQVATLEVAGVGRVAEIRRLALFVKPSLHGGAREPELVAKAAATTFPLSPTGSLSTPVASPGVAPRVRAARALAPLPQRPAAAPLRRTLAWRSQRPVAAQGLSRPWARSRGRVGPSPRPTAPDPACGRRVPDRVGCRPGHRGQRKESHCD